MALEGNELAKLIIRILADTGDLKRDLDKNKSSISKFASDAKKIFATIGISIGTAAILRELKQLLGYFVEYNSEIEQSVLGLASLVSASSDITDQTGKILSGQEKFNAALEVGKNLYQQIQTRALTTAATSQEIVQGFQSMLAPARAANLTLDETMNLSIAIVQAMQAMRLPMIQMRLEARALIEGEENMRADLMKNLGIRGDIVRQMREQGRLYDYLMEKLSAFSVAGEAQLGTWKGLKSSVKDMLSILGAMATKDFFTYLTAQLKDFLDYLGEVKNGIFVFSKEVVSNANMIKNTLNSVINHFKIFEQHYKLFLSLLAVGLKNVAIIISSLLTGLSSVWYAHQRIAYGLISLFDTLTFHKIPALNKAAKKLAEDQANNFKNLASQAKSTFDLILNRADNEEVVFKTKFDVQPFPTGVDLGDKNNEALKEKENILEKLRTKIRDLQLQFIALTDPARAAQMALEDFINETTSGHPERFAKTVDQLREAFKKLHDEQQKRALASVESEERLSEAMIKIKSAMQEVDQSYEAGLVSISNYYEKKRQLIEQSYNAEIQSLKESSQRSTDIVEQRKISIQIEEKAAESKREISRLNHEEAQSTRDLLESINHLRESRVKGMDADSDRITARFDAEMLALEERYAEAIEKVKALDNEKLAVIEEGLTKEQLLKDLMTAKDIQRAELVAKKEFAIRQQHYRNMSELYGGMADIMGGLYEATGSEIRTFFEMQKQFSIAQAFINAHEAATKAMAQGGIWGMVQAGIVYGRAIAHAMAIAQQKPKGYERGGRITEGSGVRDDVDIKVKKDEYVLPSETTKYYGFDIMEGLRKRLIPKSVFDSVSLFLTPSPIPATAMAAAGGMVTTNELTKNLSINIPITIEDKNLARQLQTGIEKTVINILRANYK